MKSWFAAHIANVRLKNLLAPGTEGGVAPPPAGRRSDVDL